MPSKPVYCWKKQRAKATQVDYRYFLSQQASPKVTLLPPFEDLLLSDFKIS